MVYGFVLRSAKPRFFTKCEKLHIPLVTIFFISGDLDVTFIRRQFSRFLCDNLFLSCVLIAFMEEKVDSHVYVEGNIVST